MFSIKSAIEHHTVKSVDLAEKPLPELATSLYEPSLMSPKD